MGLTNIYAKYVIVACLLFPALSWAQVNTTTIPGKLKILTIPHNIVTGDSVLTVDVSGNVKKIVTPGGGGSAVGINGLNGTGNIGLGGTLSGNTTEATGGYNWIFNNGTAGGNYILQLQSMGTNVTTFDVAGNIHANGVAMLASPLNGLIDLSGNNVTIDRNLANSGSVLTVANLNTGSTGHIVDFQNPAYAMFSVASDGKVLYKPIATSVAGTDLGFSMTGALKPTANNDLLIGMDLHPTYGTSTISGISTIVGGSGYPNGTHLSNVSGGAGQQAIIQVVVSGGAVQSASIIDGGVNYGVGNVLGIVITDINGNPVGSGGSVTVASITSYTGVKDFALRSWGVAEYGTDVSSQFDANSMVSKFYVDNKVISGAYTAVASATTTFTVTIGITEPNNTYNVQVTAANALTTTVVPYINNRTTTTFDVVYPAGLTGNIAFFWLVTR